MKLLSTFGITCTLLLAGCGGNGDSGGGQAPGAPLDGKSGSQTAALGSELFLSSAKARELAGRSGLMKSNDTAIDRAVTGWVFDSNLGLYVRLSKLTLNSATFLLSTDGQHNDAGSVTVTRLYGSPGHYPEAFRLDLNYISGGSSISGPLTVIFNNGAGTDYEIQSSLTSNAPSVNLTGDVHVVGNAVSGSLSANRPGYEGVSFTNVVYTANTFSADYTAPGVHGHTQINADNSGNISATDSSGNWTLTWDTSFNSTLNPPTGPAISLGSVWSW